jgi:glutamine---fructose-6-phosphate transaminase (isomerizing)
MESEIRLQLHDLPGGELQARENNGLFVGSGDSYAACLLAQLASGNKVLSCHPLDLVRNPSIADGRVVYVVSVSGKTRANILAARTAKKRGIHTVAITAKPDSPLASDCDEVVQLRYTHSPIPTAGMISFTASVITCLSLAIRLKFPKSISKLLTAAERRADYVVGEMGVSRKSYFVLADGILFPVALYGAMKLNEVIGARAVAYPAEEFCHSPLFSITKNDIILILGVQRGDLRLLAKRLAIAGFDTRFVQNSDGGILDSILHSTFFVQMLTLKIAQEMKLKECYFLRNRRLLRLSSDFIYD